MKNETTKPRTITEADVKVGQVWGCGLATCEHRRRVDAISGGRVRTTWLSPRQGYDSVDMADFVAYLNRDPASRIITDDTGAKDGPSLESRVSKVEGVLARICPEADEQVDGKGRTLVQINREIDDLCGIAEFTAGRVTKLEEALNRLIAAQVPAVQPGRNDAAAHNALATDVAAVDEGWREMLVPVSFTHEDSLMWWMTPDRKAYTGHCLNPLTDWGTFDSTLRDFVVVTDSRKDDPVYLAVRSKIAPPPNLAEWWKPEAKATTGAGSEYAVLARTHDSVPPTFRIPGQSVDGWVRHLASAHDTALKVQRELERKLADANESARQAEGRAATATARATEAESKLAELRAQLEAALN